MGKVKRVFRVRCLLHALNNLSYRVVWQRRRSSNEVIGLFHLETSQKRRGFEQLVNKSSKGKRSQRMAIISIIYWKTRRLLAAVQMWRAFSSLVIQRRGMLHHAKLLHKHELQSEIVRRITARVALLQLQPQPKVASSISAEPSSRCIVDYSSMHSELFASSTDSSEAQLSNQTAAGFFPSASMQHQWELMLRRQRTADSSASVRHLAYSIREQPRRIIPDITDLLHCPTGTMRIESRLLRTPQLTPSVDRSDDNNLCSNSNYRLYNDIHSSVYTTSVGPSLFVLQETSSGERRRGEKDLDSHGRLQPRKFQF